MALDSRDNHEQREGGANGENPGGGFPRRLTPEERRRQRIRSIAIAAVLAALVILFFLVTLVRLGGNVANRPL